MYWQSSCGKIVLKITKAQANQGSHMGACDSDISCLRNVPVVRRQLDKLQPQLLREVLREYGAWDSTELSDHNQNLSRLLWIACGDIVEGN